jgi:hypothetical protein
MIQTQPVTRYGQINKGDVLVIETKSGITFPAVAKMIIRSGTEDEEVVISLRRNHYFIMSMMLAGKSWAKNVIRIPGAVLTSYSNSTKSLKDYEDEA